MVCIYTIQLYNSLEAEFLSFRLILAVSVVTIAFRPLLSLSLVIEVEALRPKDNRRMFQIGAGH